MHRTTRRTRHDRPAHRIQTRFARIPRLVGAHLRRRTRQTRTARARRRARIIPRVTARFSGNALLSPYLCAGRSHCAAPLSIIAPDPALAPLIAISVSHPCQIFCRPSLYRAYRNPCPSPFTTVTFPFYGVCALHTGHLSTRALPRRPAVPAGGRFA